MTAPRPITLTQQVGKAPGLLEKALRVFSDVRPGEAMGVLLMFANVFLILVSYYVIKTVREPLILATGGAEVKTYAAAGQALALVGFVPLYGWLSSKVKRSTLIMVVNLFFIANIEVFYLAARASVPFVGLVFFIWVGIFSLSIIAQFWSYANDIYTKEAGERLFPVIAIGATLGSPVGSKIAEVLFRSGVKLYEMLHISAALLALSLVLYVLVNRRPAASRTTLADDALAKGGGFGLVLKSPYLLAIAALLVLLNVVNTTGEYILSHTVSKAAAEAATQGARDAALQGVAFDDKTFREGFFGSFYGSYFFTTSVVAAALQAFVASRVVRWLGIRGALLALPIVALGGYALIAAGASLMLVRLAKISENATDYSLMNTGKQLLWLPTSRAEKYKAKQAIDTFFYRCGDLLAAALVFAGTHFLGLGARGFAAVTLAIIVVWLLVALRALRLNAALAAGHASAQSETAA